MNKIFYYVIIAVVIYFIYTKFFADSKSKKGKIKGTIQQQSQEIEND